MSNIAIIRSSTVEQTHHVLTSAITLNQLTELANELYGGWNSQLAKRLWAKNSELTLLQLIIPITNHDKEIGYAAVKISRSDDKNDTIDLYGPQFQQNIAAFDGCNYGVSIIPMLHADKPNSLAAYTQATSDSGSNRSDSSNNSQTGLLGGYQIPAKFHLALWGFATLAVVAFTVALTLATLSTFSLTFDSVGYDAGNALDGLNLFDQFFDTNWSDIDVKWADKGKHVEKFVGSALATVAGAWTLWKVAPAALKTTYDITEAAYNVVQLEKNKPH